MTGYRTPLKSRFARFVPWLEIGRFRLASVQDETGFSAIGIAVIERLMTEAPGAPLHIARVAHEDIAWDIVLRHLRSFTGRVLLFAFPDSDVCDAGTAETAFSVEIRP
jgi:hypothetical protein